ncbi:MFS transporter [Phialemonium atrogriseum]|uniref:MFS transporter n=1 Tax=Phialemonium atrogriseum TaxID=1093897 RepID=A0AAJ0FCW0_9PEZI|nr:MFS transporter [Phialemonium atrogriseum]KAK1762537.1 MFS transporter [Phialemonium atrogriseum]
MARKETEAVRNVQESEVTRLLRLDKKPWYQKPNLRSLYFCLVPAVLGVEMTSGYDGSILNDFNNPQGAVLGVLNAAFSIGAVLALPVVPYVNDRFGRKHSITIGSVIILIGVVLQTASVHIAMFLISRLLLGMGIPFCISGASQLIAELAHPREAGVLNGLFNESWYVGAILAAGTTLGTFSMPNDWSWRIPSLVQIAPSLLQVTFIWFIPESPRWLLSKDRDEEAFDILVKYHAEGNREDPFVLAEFAEIRDRVRLEMDNSNRRWVELLQTPGNRKRTFIAACVGLFSQWSGNGLVSYYLAKVLLTVGISDRRTQNIINLALSCWNLVTGVTFAFLSKRIPRRTQYLIAFGGMTAVFAVWTGVSANYAQTGNHQAAAAVVAMIFIYYMFYTIMHPLTYIFITEVFPFVHRAKGVGLTQTFSRAGSAFNLFVNPIGLGNIGWKFYLVYVVWLAIETTIIYFVYPETQGHTLEELGDQEYDL